jgi:hypothetical protein
MSKYIDAATWINEQRETKSVFQNFNQMFNLESFEDAYLFKMPLNLFGRIKVR